jgi:excisionase family DNA binding protein
MEKFLIGVSEAGKLASVSPNLVRNWCTHNVLPYTRNGNRFLIRTDTLEQFLKSNTGKNLKQYETLVRPEC